MPISIRLRGSEGRKIVRLWLNYSSKAIGDNSPVVDECADLMMTCIIRR